MNYAILGSEVDLCVRITMLGVPRGMQVRNIISVTLDFSNLLSPEAEVKTEPTLGRGQHDNHGTSNYIFEMLY